MLYTPAEVVFLGDVGRAGPPLSPERVRENQLKLKYAAYLMDQWSDALCKLKPIEILDAYVAAAYEDQGMRLSKKHPLQDFCNDGIFPPGLRKLILNRYEAYAFASIRQKIDKRCHLPEPR